ncbi:MAG TPA: hypothetical protein VH701_22365 [Vicinamibacterales bacterium]|jgi:hypothetical protein
MRVLAAILAVVLLAPGLASAQDWEPYVSRQDGFTINFPGKPQVTEMTWQSQLNYKLPARVYRAARGQERYSVTVVDYSPLEQQGIERWKACPPGNSQCRDGGATIGPGYWKQDERGALVYAVSKYLRPPYQVTYYAWDWQDMVEGTSLQLNSTDGRRTLVYVAMHERKLYLLEGSVPEGFPEPGLFQQSLGWLDKDGNRIRYTETVYSNSYHGLGVYPKPAYRVSSE